MHHILKGGEDSIGAQEAIQRVYFNIGSCAEQCWVNHLSDLRQVDPNQRGFGQTAFNIGQCRRDCPSFRAVEDRLGNLLDFFLSAEGDATDLDAARHAALQGKGQRSALHPQDLVADLDREFGAGAVARGRLLFADNCARCHSSLPDTPADPFKTRDFHAVASGHPRQIRDDFLGNDKPTPVTEVGTFRCRALHSNHMRGTSVLGIRLADPAPTAGRARHSRARGAEERRPRLLPQCLAGEHLGHGAVHAQQRGRTGNLRQAGEQGERLLPRALRGRQRRAAGRAAACMPYDASVEGRFELYKRSMHELLNPKERGIKTTLTDADVLLDVGLRRWDGKQETALFDFGSQGAQGGRAGFLNGLNTSSSSTTCISPNASQRAWRRRARRSSCQRCRPSPTTC